MDVKTTIDDDVDGPRDPAAPLPALTPDVEPAGPLGLAPRIRFELSPINIRRWYNFKANRRGYWSLWFFLVLFVVTLFAEFIANDKPLFIFSLVGLVVNLISDLAYMWIDPRIDFEAREV